MNRRDVILDFTSLLDVTLIIIFFFVIFSNLDSQANRARTDEKVQELERAVHQAEDREANAKELEEQLQKEIDIVKESDIRRGENADGIIAFDKNENIKIILDMEPDAWSIRIIGNKEVIATASDKDLVDERIKMALDGAGYTNDDTIFCDFVFDGSRLGSYSAYRRIKNALSTLQKNYKYLYVSETDLSIGE